MSKNQKKLVAVFFGLLVVVKAVRWFLFDPGNPIIGMFFSFVPYCAMGAVVIMNSRSITLSILAGLAIVCADLGVDYQFRDSTDAQTPISIGYNYLIWLYVIFVAYFVLNALIKRLSA